jgi:hypothetical protein
MEDILSLILKFAYASAGVVSTAGYIPTIKDLWLHKKMSANIHSYFIWTICSVFTLLYSIFILPDLLFQIVSGLSLAACGAILILSVALNRKKLLKDIFRD